MAINKGAGGEYRRDPWTVRRGAVACPDRALQRVSSDRHPYRSADLPLYEIASVYGTTIKELIHEEFGDGIMTATDFSMDISREADPKGDRVKVVISGKFLPYKTY